MKTLTYRQVQGRQEKAVAFTANVVGDPERAAEIQQESVEDYAQRRGFTIQNPLKRRSAMAQTAGPTKDELVDTLDQVSDLLEEALDPELTREELVAKVKEIADLAAAEGDEDEGDGESDDDEDDAPGE